MRLKCAGRFARPALPLFVGNETLNPTVLIDRSNRGFGVMLLLSSLFLTQAAAQPRISLHIQRLAFDGNLLKCADGTFIAERRGELYRLSATGAYERKLDFEAIA